MIVVAGLLISVCQSLPGQDPYNLPHVMDQDPVYTPVTPEIAFSSRLAPLWMEAFQSDHVELRTKAAETIVIAKRRGMKKLEATLPTLRESLDSELPRELKLAVAKALIALDDSESAPRLAEVSGQANDPELQTIVETALIKWKADTILDVWKSRAFNSREENQARVLAIKGLLALDQTDQVENLLTLVTSKDENFRVRYSAAKAIGGLSTSGLEDTADVYLQSGLQERLLGVEILRGHESESAQNLLLKFAVDSRSVVALVAWKALLKSSKPRVLDSIVESALENKDPGLRQQAINLLKLWKNTESIRYLGPLLNDIHPQVRNEARDVLLQFSKVESLREYVISETKKNLTRDWQGIQQALLLLTKLDQKSIVNRCIEVLDHPRGEVHITAGWALERLNVPETLEPANAWAEKTVTAFKGGKSIAKTKYECLSHVIQFLGKNKHRPMEKIIVEKLIPKDQNLHPYSVRSAAIWSVAQIYKEEGLPESYFNKLMARLNDADLNNPESPEVKTSCMYAFAMTKADAAIPSIEKHTLMGNANSKFGFIGYWSLNKLKGTPIPDKIPVIRNETRWFLRPAE